MYAEGEREKGKVTEEIVWKSNLAWRVKLCMARTLSLFPKYFPNVHICLLHKKMHLLFY